MADLKISALTASTTPLAGTEVLPIVQSSTTKQVSVANLTAGRAVSAASLALTTSPLPVTSGGTGTATALTTGSVVFAGASGVYSQDNTNLFWDNTNKYLGIATNTPGYPLHIVGASYFNGTKTNTVGAASNYLGSGGYWSVRTNTSNDWCLDRYYGGSYNSLTVKNDSGDLVVTAGNVVQGTAAKGVNFTANTPQAGMTSQLLNWYEQGTFTPTLSGSGGDPTSTYTTQVGYYTRVGNLVTIYIQLFTSSYTGGSGTLQIKALPFAATNGARFNINTVRITFGVAATQICAAVDGASTTIYFDESNSGLNDTTLALSAWNSGASAGMTIFGSYTV